jgi:iron complex outermembrane receptor protein
VGGEWSLAASLSIVRAKDLDSGTNLYNIMPTNGRLSLEHRLGHWASSVEWQLVDAKTRTDTVREELQTPGYSLLNLRTAYTWRAVTIHGGIDNALDRRVGLPLGGVDFYTYNNLASVPPDRLAPVAGAGRSVNVGLTVQF